MNLKDIEKESKEEILAVQDKDALFGVEVKYLGRKGILTDALKSVATLPAEKRKEFGKTANLLKQKIAEMIAQKNKELSNVKIDNSFDVTAPGKKVPVGHLHPITLVYDEMFEIAKSLGFSIAEGPEVETDYYNFEALNVPKDHPSRDIQDSFYFNEKVLLRSQTSPVQIRYMEGHEPPIRIIAPGRVYRRDSDATHTPMFHQLEGLLVDKDVSVVDLKATLEALVKNLFGPDRKIRMRPHFFPFTEPSFEVDVSCGLCGGKGCRSCKNSGWLEILGAGMVHPSVLRAGGIDPEVYSGFAFGFGIERVAMLKYNIDDMRMLYEGDLRVVEQF